MRSVTAHLVRNSIAYAALFAALGGSALAARHLLPKNSVGTAQVINHSLARKDVHPGQAPAGSRGRPGARGLAGLRGATGAQGPPALLTASTGGGSPPASTAANTFATASITLPAAGKLLLLGRMDSISIYCGPFACSYAVGIYLDGKPVSGTGYVVPTSCPIMFTCAGSASNISVSGIATGVSAGTHQVSLAGGGGFNSPPSVGKVELTAIATG